MIESIPYKKFVYIPGVNDDELDESKIRFVKAAILIGDTVYLAWRHHMIINELGKTGNYKSIDFDNQGFIDQNGYYYGNRKFCGYWAFRNGQIKKRVRDLTSEDLWDNQGNPLTD